MLLVLSPPAPSIVPIMHQISSTMNSFTLSWPQPEQPNGIILDYELRYYEKVSVCVCVSVMAEVLLLVSPTLHIQLHINPPKNQSSP